MEKIEDRVAVLEKAVKQLQADMAAQVRLDRTITDKLKELFNG